MGLREDFLKRAVSRKLDEFQTDSGTFFLRPMTKGLKSKIEAIVSKPDKTAKDCSDVRWFVLRDCLVDADASPILAAGDRESFDKWDESFIEPMFNRVMELSNQTKDDIDELGN